MGKSSDGTKLETIRLRIDSTAALRLPGHLGFDVIGASVTWNLTGADHAIERFKDYETIKCEDRGHHGADR